MQDALKLSADQKKQLDDLQKDVDAKLDKMDLRLLAALSGDVLNPSSATALIAGTPARRRPSSCDRRVIVRVVVRVRSRQAHREAPLDGSTQLGPGKARPFRRPKLLRR